MRCGKAKEWLSLELDGQLPPNRTVPLENHLQQCAECRRYRVDLRLGRRLLRSQEPRLSPNFDWRLQLRLKQVLQEAAQVASVPWAEPAGGIGHWLRGLGLATAGTLAAIVALALLVFPSPENPLPGVGGSPGLQPAGGDARTVARRAEAIPSDRLPIRSGGLSRLARTGSGLGRPVSGTERIKPFWDPPLPVADRLGGGRLTDWQTIAKQAEEIRLLRLQLSSAQSEVAALKAQLDTAWVRPQAGEQAVR